MDAKSNVGAPDGHGDRRRPLWHCPVMPREAFDELHHAVLPPRSLGVAAFSTIVEWYDFTLYLYFATVLSRVFYGGGSGSLLLTLGGFADRLSDAAARRARSSAISATATDGGA